MKYFTKILFFLAFLFCWGKVNAQYYLSGQDPARVKWSKIENNNYTLIFPNSLSYSIADWANAFNLLHERSKSENMHLEHMPIIIHGHTAYSNGLVLWAPKRSELFFSPSVDASSNLWVHHLAIHEFRHMQQMSELSNAIPKLYHWILGEQFTGSVLGLFIPQWFMEGDAVDVETRFSKSGRGRDPFFTNEYVPSLLSNKNYSYLKAFHGSYKHYVPSYYHMGYQLVNRANSLQGFSAWHNLPNYVGRKFYTLSPFNRYLKNNLGMGQKELYNNTMDSIRSEWARRYEEGNFDVNPDSIPQKSKRYIEYSNLWKMNDSEAIAMKESYDRVSQLVRIKLDGELKEEKLFNIGYVSDENISGNDGLVIWSAVEQQGRWEHADKTIIYIYNTISNEKERLPFNEFLFSPNVYPKGNKFIAVKQKKNGESVLSVYSMDGRSIKDIEIEGAKQIVTPVWNSSGDAVYCFVKNLQGRSIVKVDTENGSVEEVLPPSHFSMSHLRYINDKLYFSGYYDGRMAIYSIDESKNMYLCYAPFITAKCPVLTATHSFVIERDYTGHQLKKGDLFNERKIELDNVQREYAELINEAELLDFSLESKVDYSEEVSEYKKTKVVNIHSWMPELIFDELEEIVSFTALSQNELGTVLSSAMLGYDFLNNKDLANLKISYMAWAPVIDMAFGYANARNIGAYNLDGLNISNKQRTYELDLAVSLPLLFQNNNKYFTVLPKLGYEYYSSNFERNLEATNPLYVEGSRQSQSVYARLYTSMLVRAPKSNVVSSFGTWKNFGINLSKINTEQSNESANYNAHATWAELGYVLPSLIKRHAVDFYYGIQNKDGDIYITDYIKNARGYNDFYNNAMQTVQTTYRFPIWDTDLAIGRALYIKRIKGECSYDVSRLTNEYLTANMVSYGGGLSAELNLFNFFAGFDFGCQLYKLDYYSQTAINFSLGIKY